MSPRSRNEYKAIQKRVMLAMQDMDEVKAPLSEYLAALEKLKEEVESYLGAAIDAAQGAVKRQRGSWEPK